MKKSNLSGKEDCSFFDVRILFRVVHKLFKKKNQKGLDFSVQDEYNTLSTQRKGVLNNQRPSWNGPKAPKKFSLYFIIGGQEL
ncbi:MAG: hypothetical protein MR538_04200 [Faecalibacterium prausnitzii]|nr:hypothetical protein [Faecalibacterium prausnitzii]